MKRTESVPKFIPASENKTSEMSGVGFAAMRDGQMSEHSPTLGQGARPTLTHIRSSTLRDSFEKAKKLHSNNAMRKKLSQSSHKAKHNFVPNSQIPTPSGTRERVAGEENQDSRYNEAISVISDIFPVSHSEFVMIGGIDSACKTSKREPIIKQSSLVSDPNQK